MTGVLRWPLVVFSQVSAFRPCWAVRWLAIRAERFARMLHANRGGKANARLTRLRECTPHAGGWIQVTGIDAEAVRITGGNRQGEL
jgi:hypothetical protein